MSVDSGPNPSDIPIGEAVSRVIDRIAAACRRVGRDPGSVTLLAATKTVEPGEIVAAVRAGVRVVGENIVQELISKQDALAGVPEVGALRWDFIGTLQRNKVKHVVGRAALIHGVDSIRLAEEISSRAEAAGLVQDVLLEVNASGEETKHGFAPPELPAASASIGRLPGVRVRGVMTMAPAGDPLASRRCFGATAALAAEPWWPSGASELSMGMTEDLEIAVEEGATIVRVGTAIFGARCDLGLGA